MDEVIRGYNVTVFAYGQTGSGKTHTMTGDAGSPGIATLAFEHLFSSIRASPSMKFNITLSIFEIYNDQIFDLFDPKKKAKVEMQSGGGRGLRFTGLQEKAVRSEEEVSELVRRGMEGKAMGSNYRHEHSSRSHTVVRLVLESTNISDDELNHVLVSSFMLVDLAGSETVHDNTAKKATDEGTPFLRVFPLCALVPRVQGSSGAVATVQFVWRGHAETPTTRAGPWPDFASRLE